MWCVMPPYSADSVFMLLWGYARSVEIGATVEFQHEA